MKTRSCGEFVTGRITKGTNICQRFITFNMVPQKIHPKWLMLLFLSILSYVGIQYYINYSTAFWNPQHPNYFIDPGDFESMGFTVNTPSCKILNLSAWDKSISSLVNSSHSYTTCYDRYKHWTFINESNLIMNVTAIEESGYSMKTIECCYKTISRVEQKIDSYNELADAVSIVSDTCKPLRKEVNPLTEEFFRVKCTAKYWPAFRDVVYRNYHTIAQPNRSEETMKKINFWSGRHSDTQSQSQSQRQSHPPNVLILGIDSMSRLNFIRTMKKTRAYLERIGAIELLGYTKRENTFPNNVAFLSGYSEEQLEKICYPSPLTAQDFCPYIWKEFNAANYLTAHLEDMPGIQSFNHYKTGFVKQQVDFYLRPFMLDLFGPIYEKDCIGPDTQDQKIFNYIQSIRNLSLKNNIPSFIFTWITNLAHRDLNAASHADHLYEDFLRNLNLSNTILFFVSDHGFRYGSFRETFAGWFEDKLPNFWVYLPLSIRVKYSSWYQALKVNSKRLLSPFDFYHTVNHILEEFSNISAGQEIVVKNTTYIRNIGQSFFRQVPESRKCSDAGIQNHFCPCATPKKLLLNNSNLYNAANASVNFINKLLPSQCSKLKVIEITAGGILDGSDNDNNDNHTYDNDINERLNKINRTTSDSAKQKSSYIVAFVTDPGHFLFEATVEYDYASQNYQVTGNVLRMNKMTRDVSCVHEAEIEKLCYCS